MMTTFSEAVRGAGDLTKSQKKLVGYIEGNKGEVADLTLGGLAEKTGLSTATVVRGVRALGFSGYAQLQKAVRAELYIRRDSPAAKPVKGEVEIRKTVPEDTKLPQAVKEIGEARSVYVIGLRESYAAAVYLAGRLAAVREDVRLIRSDGMGYPEQISGAGPRDVITAFFYPRYSRDTAAVLTAFREKGGRAVIITDEEHEAIDIYGDVFLPCERRDTGCGYSYAAPVQLCDRLAEAVYAAFPGRMKREDSLLEDSLYLRY